MSRAGLPYYDRDLDNERNYKTELWVKRDDETARMTWLVVNFTVHLPDEVLCCHRSGDEQKCRVVDFKVFSYGVCEGEIGPP